MDKRLSKEVRELDEKVILFLLATYHQLDVGKIFSMSFRMSVSEYLNDDGSLNIKVYEDDKLIPQDSWDEFISKYRQMFKERNPERAGSLPSCKTKMKELFSRNPEFTPEIVLTATKRYLRETDPQYVMKSHYFIYKGRKQDWDSNLENWCNRYIEHLKNHGNTDTTEGRAIKGLM